MLRDRHLFVTERGTWLTGCVMPPSVPAPSVPAPLPQRGRLRGFARGIRPLAVVAVVSLVVAASMTGTASAQDVEGGRAKVKRLAAELDRLEAKASLLDEQYLQTQLEVGRVRDQVAENQAAVDDAKARMAEARKQANDYIVSAYMGAGSQVAGLGAADPNRAVNERVLLETLHGDREQVADDLRAAQVDLGDRTAELEASSKALSDTQAKQRSVRADLEASVGAQQELLDSANSELRAAIEAEQERAAAAAAAKAAAEQKARQEAAAAAAARAQSTTSARSGAAAPTTAGRPGRPAPAPKPAPAPNPTAPPAPVAPVGSGAGAAIAAAQSVLGTPYRWAGASPATGFDCSGLIMWAWARGGRSLPHSSGAQYAATQRISLDQLQPGDLVFFNNPISHAGLYIGGGMMIHSPHTGDVVKISPINRVGKLIRAGRVA